jgi:uncharacterized membrane protein YfcA
MDVATALGLLTLAAGVGVYGTVIGAGGGFVLIPGLVLLFGFSGVEAVGTGAVALGVIGATGAVAYDRKGLVDRDVALAFALTAVPVAMFSSWQLAGRVDSDLFIAVLGFLLIALAVFVLVVHLGRGPVQPERPARRGPLAAMGAAIGLMSGMFAVGGGLVTVPTFARIQRMAPHRAAATTAASSMTTSVAASVGHGFAGNVDWPSAAIMIVGAAIGSTTGARLSGRLSELVVLSLLAAGLVTAGVPLIVRAL